MKKHIKFPSIEQFKNIISTVNNRYSYLGKDEQGNAIYDYTKTKPVLKFKGTVKLHGTNAGICYNNIEGLWCQSRENIITVEKDNAGFAQFVNKYQNDLIEYIKAFSPVDLDKNTISIYFEWVGKGIQKSVAISELDKRAFVIGIKITPFDESLTSYWIDSSKFKLENNFIYNIEDYETFEIEIDFNNPLLSQNKIIEMTLKVEEECPVSKEFGISGIGEGIVFTHILPDNTKLVFKSKGEKHSKSSKVTTLPKVDDEKLNKIIEVANKVTPDWRLQQQYDLVFDTLNGGQFDIKKTGNFIKAVMSDIVKEDLDILNSNNIEIKDIAGKVAEKCKKFLF